jgi:hypothetical protein
MESETLAWSVYIIPGDTMVAVAVSENGDTTYIAILQASADEFDGLAEDLLIPAIMTFTPAE